MTIRKNKKILIFSGGNYRAIVAFCRELCALNVDFFIVARTKEDLLLKTKYKKNVLAIRTKRETDLVDMGNCICQVRARTGFANFVICPSTEFLNLFILEHRTFFEKLNCEIPLVSIEKYKLVSNKYSFSEQCAKRNIKIPRSYSDYNNLDFPFVAKPLENINKDNKSLYPYLIFNEKDLEEFLKNEKLSDFYFQEYVSGKSYYLLYYFSPMGGVYKFSQQNLLQQAQGKSIVLAWPSNIHLESIADKFEIVLRDIGFWGLAMVEIRQCGNEFYFIELNPRLWGPSQLVVDAQSNIFKAFIRDVLGECTISLPCEKAINDIRYLWLNGIVESLLQRKNLISYIKSPKVRLWFIVKIFLHDVYFRSDTFRLFFYELYLIFKNRNRKHEAV